MVAGALLFLLLQAGPATKPDVSAVSRREAGIAAYNRHEYSKAIEHLQAAAAAVPAGSSQHLEVSLLLGQSYYLQALYLKAIPWLEKARAAASTEVEYMLGACYIQTRQSEKSAEAFARMFGVAPASAAAHLLTAQIMMRLSFEEDAEVELRKALAADAKLPGVHLLLGELATFRGEIDNALKLLRQELALAPNSSLAYYKIGDAHMRREQWKEAISSLQRSVWLNPAYSGPYILLGKAYLKLESPANAEGMLRRALELDPQNSTAQYLLGKLLADTGRPEEGKRLMQRSWEVRSQRPAL